MPTYRGNRGNLLQHWLLAELVSLVRRQVQATARLCFIDGHAMSPYAVRNATPGQTGADFDTVAARLPGRGSAYEHAWHELKQGRSQYPSSASLVHHLWNGPLQFLLCEADADTADEIAEWQATLSVDTSVALYRGDWRATFRRGLSPGAAAHVISFDPYKFDRHAPPSLPNPGHMGPSDIVRAAAFVLDLPAGPVVVQLSTYSANNANSQDDVVGCIVPVFGAAGLALGAIVRADGNMMSMVFTRDVPDIREAQLQERFSSWLEQATAPTQDRDKAVGGLQHQPQLGAAMRANATPKLSPLPPLPRPLGKLKMTVSEANIGGSPRVIDVTQPVATGKQDGNAGGGPRLQALDALQAPMTNAKCKHGIDPRFCSTCCAQERSSGRTTLAEILWSLNDEKIRATYGAVADLLGVIPQAMGKRLGNRRPEASWVVSAIDGYPTGYRPTELHEDLLSSNEIISTGSDLTTRIVKWRLDRNQ